MARRIRVVKQSDESLTATIVNKVAEKEGTDPRELPALYDSIDCDALNALYADEARAPALVEFTYNDYIIEVTPYPSETTTPVQSAVD